MASRVQSKLAGGAGNVSLQAKAYGPIGLEDNRPIIEESSNWAQKVEMQARRPGKEVVSGPFNDGPRNQMGTARDPVEVHVKGASSSKIARPRITGNAKANTRTGNGEGKSRNGNDQSGNAGRSWADKVRASSAKSRFSLDSGFVHEHGATEFSLPDELIEENFEDWTRCLVGFVPGVSFPFHAARSIALREWKQYGIESVNSYEGFFLFRFHNEEKLHEVLADGPWLFGGKYMMLQQWHACFVFDKSKIDKVPVWIRLKGLPFTLWTHKALSFVASIIGKPLACDRATFEKSRLSFARVCVEVDASKAFVHNFSLKCKLSSTPIQIGVEYEWKPKRCSKCCVYGHNCETARKEEVQCNVDATNQVVIEKPKEGQMGLIDALTLVSKPVDYFAAISKGMDERGTFHKGDMPYGSEMDEVEMQTVIQGSAEFPREKEQMAPSVLKVAGHVFSGTDQDVERGILTTWERKELDNLGLIPVDLEELSSIGESSASDSIEDQGVLRVDPLMVIGAAESNCGFNKSASLDGSNSPTPRRSNSLMADEHHSWAVLSGDSSYSSKPRKAKKKGQPKKGGQPPSHSNLLQPQ